MIEVKEDYSLKPYNTFAIDVKCRYFVESDEEEALRAFVADYEWQPSGVLIFGFAPEEEVISFLRKILPVLFFIRRCREKR